MPYYYTIQNEKLDKYREELIQPQINLQVIAQKYFDFYDSMQGAYRSAAISLIDTKQLTRLAEEIKEIVTKNEIVSSFDRK